MNYQINSKASSAAAASLAALDQITEEAEQISLLASGEIVVDSLESFQDMVAKASARFRVAELDFTPNAAAPAPRLMNCDEYVQFARKNVRLALGLAENASYHLVRQFSGLPALSSQIDAADFEAAEYSETYAELKGSDLAYLLDRSYNGNYKMLLI